MNCVKYSHGLFILLCTSVTGTKWEYDGLYIVNQYMSVYIYL
jgi:hypothetical protein